MNLCTKHFNFNAKCSLTRWKSLFACFIVFAIIISSCLRASARKNEWSTIWSSALCPGGNKGDKTLNAIPATSTLREIIHPSQGGRDIRIRLSNYYGEQPIVFSSVHIALKKFGSEIVPNSDRIVSFLHNNVLTLKPGKEEVSDPISLHFESFQDIEVSLYFAQETPITTVHYLALQDSYIASGDNTKSESLDKPVLIHSWPFLKSVDVKAPSISTVVAFGSSITDGLASGENLNRRWPDYLAKRINEARLPIAVVEAGISGNRLLYNGSGKKGFKFGESGLERFQKDVVSLSGVSHVILLLGSNDIVQPGNGFTPIEQEVTSQDVITGITTLVKTAHDHGIRVICGTFTPFAGMKINVYNAKHEKVREEVNQWVRTTKIIDGFADFDEAVRDPNSSLQLRSDFDSGDHLHPNSDGYRAMAEIIDLNYFTDKN